jgi:plastocyanin
VTAANEDPGPLGRKEEERMRRRPWMLIVIGLMALTLTAAACSSDDVGGGGGGDGGGGGGTSVSGDITAVDFAFSPNTFEVASGETITVANADSTDHTFTVTDTDVDVALAPGATEETTIDLDAGDYDFVCKIHPDMTGTLTVT